MNVYSGEVLDVRCGAAKRSRCEPCAELKRGDVAAIGRSGLSTDRGTDRAYFVTLTAPGQDVLPWDRSKCSHGPEVACSGRIGCVVEAHAAARWNHDVTQYWSWFMTEVRRKLPPGCEVQFFKTWEDQKRGVLHAHALMRITGPVTDRRARAVLRWCAHQWHFGRQLDVRTLNLKNDRDSAMVAGYLAKYCAKGADSLPDLVRVNADGEIAFGGVRPWSASRRWGWTMRQVQQFRVAYAVARAAGAGGDPEGTAGSAAGAGGPLDLNPDLYATSVPGLRIFRPSGVQSAV